MNNERQINNILKTLEINKLWMRKYPQYDDLYQISITALYNTFKEELINIYERNELNKLFKRIVNNQLRWTNSKYRLMFQKHIVYTDELKERPGGVTPEIDLEKECKKITNDWYKQYILIEYAEQGSARAVNELTGIPTRSIHNTIANLKKKMQ